MKAPWLKTPWFALAVAAALLAPPPDMASAQEIRQERVSFAAGASSATLKGTVRGYQSVDYLLGAAAGQTMTVTLKTSNASNYFNVLPPGSDEALFIGSTSGNTFTGTLPAKGDYTVRVYLMRNAARRDETAKYTLSVAIGEAPAANPLGTAPASDAKVAGTPYHATGTVPCSAGAAAKGSAECAFGVVRGAPGNADVHLTAPGGQNRVLVFRGAAVSTAAPGTRLQAEKQGDEWDIRIDGDEIYLVPDAVIVGG